MGTSTIQYYPCQGDKCKNEINDANHKAGPLPKLCESCKRKKQLAELRFRQKNFYHRKKWKKELGV